MLSILVLIFFNHIHSIVRSSSFHSLFMLSKCIYYVLVYEGVHEMLPPHILLFLTKYYKTEETSKREKEWRKRRKKNKNTRCTSSLGSVHAYTYIYSIRIFTCSTHSPSAVVYFKKCLTSNIYSQQKQLQ